MSKSRNWCLTLNNPKEGETDKLIELAEDGKVTYLVIGNEEGEKGTPHCQIYLEYHTSVTMNSLKNMIGKRYHMEIRRGTGLEASEYCKKDGDWSEWGKLKNRNGVRKDWGEVRNRMKEGSGIRELLDEGYNSLQYLQYMEKVAKYSEEPRSEKPLVIWLYGSSGTGKSRWAHENLPDGYWSETFQWWDGYDQHETVIIDDYRADFCKFHELLKLIDRYPFKVPIKGGYRQMKCKIFVFTSNKGPEDIWRSRTDEDIIQLLRRIDIIVDFDDDEYCASGLKAASIACNNLLDQAREG